MTKEFYPNKLSDTAEMLSHCRNPIADVLANAEYSIVNDMYLSGDRYYSGVADAIFSEIMDIKNATALYSSPRVNVVREMRTHAVMETVSTVLRTNADWTRFDPRRGTFANPELFIARETAICDLMIKVFAAMCHTVIDHNDELPATPVLDTLIKAKAYDAVYRRVIASGINTVLQDELAVLAARFYGDIEASLPRGVPLSNPFYIDEQMTSGAYTYAVISDEYVGDYRGSVELATIEVNLVEIDDTPLDQVLQQARSSESHPMHQCGVLLAKLRNSNSTLFNELRKLYYQSIIVELQMNPYVPRDHIQRVETAVKKILN